jgi:hypothetical protein
MTTIKIDVVLYGSLASLMGGRHIAQRTVELPSGATKGDLLAHLGVPPEDRGYLFINAVLYDMPGLETDGQDPLYEGDHVGIFSTMYMWPYQYRDGVRMSESLKKALRGGSAMHHTYTGQTGQEELPS